MIARARRLKAGLPSHIIPRPKSRGFHLRFEARSFFLAEAVFDGELDHFALPRPILLLSWGLRMLRCFDSDFRRLELSRHRPKRFLLRAWLPVLQAVVNAFGIQEFGVDGFGEFVETRFFGGGIDLDPDQLGSVDHQTIC